LKCEILTYVARQPGQAPGISGAGHYIT
jgi:hypothetical protein